MNGLLFGSANPSADLSEGLIMHHLLNNNPHDSAGSYDGDNIGNPTYEGDSVFYDGSDYIDTNYKINSSDGLDTPFTISVWYLYKGVAPKGEDSSDEDVHPLVCVLDLAGNTFSLSFTVDMTNNTVGFQLLSASVSNRMTFFNTSTIEDLSVGYHHYVVTYDGSKTLGGVKLYCNGTLLVNAGALIGTYTGMNRDTTVLGSFFTTSSGWYRYALGNMSNSRLYNEVKDQVFIEALYDEGYYPKPLPLPTTTGLVAHYPLTGTAEDTTSNYDGIESVSYVDDTEFGSVAEFDGISNYISTGNLYTEITYPFTVSYWAYCNIASDSTQGGITCADTSVAYKLYSTQFVGLTNTIRQTWYNGDGTFTEINSQVISKSGWYLITAQYDNNNFKLYTNDSFKATNTGTYAEISGIDNFQIGNLIRDTTSYYDGKIRGVKVYKDNLTLQQITDIYNYENNFRFIDIDEGLKSYYPLALNGLDNHYHELDGTPTDLTHDGLGTSFNGTSSILSVSKYATGGTEGYLSFWIDGDATVISEAQDNATDHISWVKFISGEYLEFFTKTTNVRNRIWIETTKTIGEYTHFIVGSNGSSYYAYINGNPVSFVVNEGVNDGKWFGDMVTSDNCTIGGIVWSSTNYYFTGKISKLRSSIKTISPEQAKVIYDTEKGDYI